MAKLFAARHKPTGRCAGSCVWTADGSAERARKWSHRSEVQAVIEDQFPVESSDWEVVEIDPTWLDRRQAELHAAMMSERDAAEVTR